MSYAEDRGAAGDLAEEQASPAVLAPVPKHPGQAGVAARIVLLALQGYANAESGE